MRLTRDLARGNHPLREVIHNNTLYREVPYNGNVYSHLHHQHPRFDTAYLSSLELSGLISPTQRELLSVFHRVHDLPEMSTGDHFAPDKHEGHIEQDTHAIGLILDYASIDYTPEERAFMQSLFARFEGNDTVFKPGEIINYFRDAINVFNNAQYYAHDIYFALSIFNNYFKRFLDRSHTITLIGDTPALQKSSTLPLQDIPLARVFFRDNASKIDSMIEMGIAQRADIEHPTHFPFQDPQELHTLLQTREQLKVVYNIA